MVMMLLSELTGLLRVCVTSDGVLLTRAALLLECDGTMLGSHRILGWVCDVSLDISRAERISLDFS